MVCLGLIIAETTLMKLLTHHKSHLLLLSYVTHNTVNVAVAALKPPSLCHMLRAL